MSYKATRIYLMWFLGRLTCGTIISCGMTLSICQAIQFWQFCIRSPCFLDHTVYNIKRKILRCPSSSEKTLRIVIEDSDHCINKCSIDTVQSEWTVIEWLNYSWMSTYPLTAHQVSFFISLVPGPFFIQVPIEERSSSAQ